MLIAEKAIRNEQTGRTIASTAYTAAFDYDGQMTSLTQGSNTTTFAYDALGRRVSRTAGGTTTSYLYDGGAVLLEKQGSTTTGTYTYGAGLIRKDGETPLYDGTGSARAETNSSQSVTSTLTPDAFGNAIANTGSTASSYQYGAASGYRNDGDAGLLKVGCRYYDPQVGAFTTRDTYLDQKPYLYCEHDPVNATDPSGHDGFWDRRGQFWYGLLGGGKYTNFKQFTENADTAIKIKRMINDPPPLPPWKSEPDGGRDLTDVMNKYRNIHQKVGVISAGPVAGDAIKTIYLPRPLKMFKLAKQVE